MDSMYIKLILACTNKSNYCEWQMLHIDYKKRKKYFKTREVSNQISIAPFEQV